MGKIGCVAIVRNEERHIAEWLAWQVLLGFDAVILLDNASTDQTPRIARSFAARFDVRVRDHPSRAPDYQIQAYQQVAEASAGEFEWLAFFDADEFLVLDGGLELKSLLAARTEAAIGIPWAIFGSSGHRQMPAGLTVETFRHRAAAQFEPNRHIKSIIRPRLMRHCQNPHVFEMAGSLVSLAGQPMPQDIQGHLASTPDYTAGKLHHYFTRSHADWQAKLARGYPDVTRAPEEFDIYDRNEEYDDTAARHAACVRTVLRQVGAPKHRFALAACARWETPYIVEWLNYHRILGFDHVFLYCNDDDPAELYARILPFTQGPAPFVSFRHHPVQGQQFEMYAHFLEHGLAQTEWAGFLDIDEFLRLAPGQTITQFMQNLAAEADCVLFNWIWFGTSGHKTPPEGNVLEHYTRRSASIHPFTKFLARSSILKTINLSDRQRAHGFWHEIALKLDHPARCVNALGEDMNAFYRLPMAVRSAYVNEPRRRDSLLATALIQHYAFRSEAAFWGRAARGLQGDFAGQARWREIAEGPDFQGHLHEWNEVADPCLAGFWALQLRQAWQNDTGQNGAGCHGVKNSAPGQLYAWAQICTAEQENPHAAADLGAICTITAIQLRLDQPGQNLRLEVSIDGAAWAELGGWADRQADEPGIWNGPGTAWARYIRVTRLGHGRLQIGQLDVFGGTARR